ncbi:hypothetical protein [Brevibacillus sp. Leaf182]|uniref:hypothetical protein n=1 Tax=Brevibacillus sp. Leaf182 TaxID=1736290 RepID=UPI000A7B1FE5|nr:hypothetical protein [Brevibacillus sp. Leaf182]
MKKATLQKTGSIVICLIGLYLLITSLDYGLLGFLYLAIGIWNVFTYFGKSDE